MILVSTTATREHIRIHLNIKIHKYIYIIQQWKALHRSNINTVKKQNYILKMRLRTSLPANINR